MNWICGIIVAYLFLKLHKRINLDKTTSSWLIQLGFEVNDMVINWTFFEIKLIASDS